MNRGKNCEQCVNSEEAEYEAGQFPHPVLVCKKTDSVIYHTAVAVICNDFSEEASDDKDNQH